LTPYVLKITAWGLVIPSAAVVGTVHVAERKLKAMNLPYHTISYSFNNVADIYAAYNKYSRIKKITVQRENQVSLL